MKQYRIHYYDAFAKTLKENGLRIIDLDRLFCETNGKHVRSMQAWEIETEAEDLETGEVLPIKVLQSYYTLVAYKMNGETVRCGHWSSTTSKQTTIWSRY